MNNMEATFFNITELSYRQTALKWSKYLYKMKDHKKNTLSKELVVSLFILNFFFL